MGRNDVTRRSLLLGTGAAAVLTAQPKTKPHIFLITCENLGPHLRCYGYPSAQSPTFDAFSSTGTRFDRAYANSGVGTVSRSAMRTGMYPTTIGTHMDGRGSLPVFIKPFTDYLRQAGYWSPTAKSRIAPAGVPVFEWKRLDAVNPARVRLRGQAYERYIAAVKPDLRKGVEEPPALPPQFEDNEESRQDWANYHALIALLDRQFASALRTVPQDAVVIFCSEYGFTLREGNSAAYESGTHVPLMIRMPGAGLQLPLPTVMLMDLAPTILNLAGIAIPTHMQGQAFLGPRTIRPRRTVYATVDRADNRYVTIRSVRDSKYRYVRNYTTGKEELYDTSADANEVKNVADSEASTLTRMREQLDRWRVDTHDLGLLPESELAAREGALRNRYAIGRQPGFDALQRRLSEAAIGDQEDKVRAALLDEDAAVRAVAVARTRNEPERRKLLTDSNAAVRVAAARVIRRDARQDSGALKVLLREMRSQEEWVRMQAVLAVEDLAETDDAVLNAVRALAKIEGNATVAAVANRFLKGKETPRQ